MGDGPQYIGDDVDERGAVVVPVRLPVDAALDGKIQAKLHGEGHFLFQRKLVRGDQPMESLEGERVVRREDDGGDLRGFLSLQVVLLAYFVQYGEQSRLGKVAFQKVVTHLVADAATGELEILETADGDHRHVRVDGTYHFDQLNTVHLGKLHVAEKHRYVVGAQPFVRFLGSSEFRCDLISRLFQQALDHGACRQVVVHDSKGAVRHGRTTFRWNHASVNSPGLLEYRSP